MLKKTEMRGLWRYLAGGLVAVLVVVGLLQAVRGFREKEALKRVISRLEADSRIAQVLVSGVQIDPATQKTLTTIKFLEYDVSRRPLAPRYFTFSGNIIQFQSLVVRFKDFYVERGDPARGKSAYLFLTVFFLDGPQTEEFVINPARGVPLGYQLEKKDAYTAGVERAFWERFWEYALDPAAAKRVGIKNAQIEAPGTKFVPGMLYTIRIEHDGGMRIDVEPLPEILKGEVIQF
ncbi:MAG: hypothetical protein PHS61_03265 [Candidatus Omnitrophica bacterium]|nr:hypothetical protein [Candidatus Omnitrophota bacterium]